MKTRLLRLILATAFIVSIFSSAYAQSSSNIDFSEMDQDQDGKISKTEFQDATYQQAFNQADANGDGKIDYAEWQKYDTSPESKKHFNDLDQDRNGDLSLVEFKNGTFSFLNPEKILNGKKPAGDTSQSPDQIFNQLDNDQNNLLTDEEVPSNGGVKLVSFKF